MSSSFSPFWPVGTLFPSDVPLPVSSAATFPDAAVGLNSTENGSLPGAHLHGALPVSQSSMAPPGLSTVAAAAQAAICPTDSHNIAPMSTPQSGPSDSLMASSAALNPPQPMQTSHNDQMLTAYFYPAQRYTTGNSQAKGTNWWCDAFGPYQIEQGMRIISNLSVPWISRRRLLS